MIHPKVTSYLQLSVEAFEAACQELALESCAKNSESDEDDAKTQQTTD